MPVPQVRAGDDVVRRTDLQRRSCSREGVRRDSPYFPHVSFLVFSSVTVCIRLQHLSQMHQRPRWLKTERLTKHASTHLYTLTPQFISHILDRSTDAGAELSTRVARNKEICLVRFRKACREEVGTGISEVCGDGLTDPCFRAHLYAAGA